MLDRKWPRGLGKLAVCVDLSPTLLVVGGGNMSLLAEAVLWWWYLGYVLLGTSLLGMPWRGQLIVPGLPELMFLMQLIAYSFVAFKYVAASVLPPWSGCAVSCRNLQFLLTSSIRGCPSRQPRAQKGHAMQVTAGDGTHVVYCCCVHALFTVLCPLLLWYLFCLRPFVGRATER